MASTTKATFLLDVSTWDICLDASGNWAIAQPPYATAQDVASAIKTFLAEPWYDTSLGVPYFGQILGETPPIAIFRALMVKAALTVPGVVSAQCTVNAFVGRKVSGQVTFTDDLGQTTTVAFNGLAGQSSWTADSAIVSADSSVFTA